MPDFESVDQVMAQFGFPCSLAVFSFTPFVSPGLAWPVCGQGSRPGLAGKNSALTAQTSNGFPLVSDPEGPPSAVGHANSTTVSLDPQLVGEIPSPAKSFQLLKIWGDRKRVFPWMSLTKLVTSRIILGAVENQALDLDQGALTVGEVNIPAGVTVRHLLSHASGINSDQERFIVPCSTRRIYSNAGYELLAQLLSHYSGISFQRWAQQMIIDPLDLQIGWSDSAAWGISGDLNDLIRLAKECVSPSFLSWDLHRAWCQPAFPGLPGILPGYGQMDNNLWGLGPEIKDHKSPHWTASSASKWTYGHFGQSGSFLWIDPLPGLGAVFLGEKRFGPLHQRLWPQLNQQLFTVFNGAINS